MSINTFCIKKNIFFILFITCLLLFLSFNSGLYNIIALDLTISNIKNMFPYNIYFIFSKTELLTHLTKILLECGSLILTVIFLSSFCKKTNAEPKIMKNMEYRVKTSLLLSIFFAMFKLIAHFLIFLYEDETSLLIPIIVALLNVGAVIILILIFIYMKNAIKYLILHEEQRHQVVVKIFTILFQIIAYVFIIILIFEALHYLSSLVALVYTSGVKFLCEVILSIGKIDNKKEIIENIVASTNLLYTTIFGFNIFTLSSQLFKFIGFALILENIHYPVIYNYVKIFINKNNTKKQKIIAGILYPIICGVMMLVVFASFGIVFLFTV